MPRRRESLIRRGDVWTADIPGVGAHPVVVVPRRDGHRSLTSLVCVLVTSRFRGHVAEVELGADEGLAHDSAASCDNVFTLPSRARSTRRRGSLGPARLTVLDGALMVAVGARLNAERDTRSDGCGSTPDFGLDLGL